MENRREYRVVLSNGSQLSYRVDHVRAQEKTRGMKAHPREDASAYRLRALREITGHDVQSWYEAGADAPALQAVYPYRQTLRNTSCALEFSVVGCAAVAVVHAILMLSMSHS